MTQQNTMPDRYKRVDGRWGAYVVDTFTSKELDLINVLEILNTRTPDHTDLLKQARDKLDEFARDMYDNSEICKLITAINRAIGESK